MLNPDTITAIAQFYEHIDMLLLILVRVIAFFITIPVISGMYISTLARLVLAVSFSIVIFLSGSVTVVAYNNSVPGYFLLLLTEFLAGAFMGYLVFFIFNILYYVGQLVDYQIGLSMMNVLDPISQIQVPIVGNLYYLAISALLVVSGGLHSFIGAFFYSYQVLPLGVAQVIGNANAADLALLVMTEFMVMGVKIALPVMGSILVVDAMLGILVKAVPQMNVFVVGMPIKLLLGLVLLLTVMLPTLSVVYNRLFDSAFNAMNEMIWGLSP